MISGLILGFFFCVGVLNGLVVMVLVVGLKGYVILEEE